MSVDPYRRAGDAKSLANGPPIDSRSESTQRQFTSRDAHWDRADQASNENPWAHDGNDSYAVPQQVRGFGCFSWILILLLVAGVIALRDVGEKKSAPLPPLDDTPVSTRGLQELQSRGIIGASYVLRPEGDEAPPEVVRMFLGDPNVPGDVDKMDAMWNQGTLGQRLQYTIVAGEIVGPDKALELLGRILWDLKMAELVPTKEQDQLIKALKKLYQDFKRKKFDAPSLNAQDRRIVLDKLGWYGRVALTPRQSPDKVARETNGEPAVRLVFVLVGFIGGLIILGLLGLIGLPLFGIGAMVGTIKIGLKPGTPASGVYAETFVVWMLMFVGGQVLIELLPDPKPVFALQLILMFGSLLCLVWPVLRGISLRQVRQDLGLTWGRSGILEPMWGILGYIMMLPMLAVGFALTLLLLLMSNSINPNGAGGIAGAGKSPWEPQQMVSHPIVDVLLSGDWGMRLQLFILACVAAPIVEEIMFRGVMYRQLRDATWSWNWLFSSVFSALLTSFIFAAIHPQGYIAVPALMGIACGCTLTREWRDSLWASMVIHGINNGLILAVLVMSAL